MRLRCVRQRKSAYRQREKDLTNGREKVLTIRRDNLLTEEEEKVLTVRRKKCLTFTPDGKSALMLVAARLKYVADSEWGSRRYLDVSLLKEQSC